MDNADLAADIARDIFAAGDEPHLGERGKCTRIAFIGGQWNKQEWPMGGFCEEALARCIEQSLNRHAPSEDTRP